MARIRSIKPEFPHSETVGRLSRDARLLFVQLWTIVDDEGRARAASRMLASLLYPYDDDAPKLIDGWLAELEREQCLIRYEIDGSRYIQLTNWLKHQKIDHPSKSKIPDPREASRVLAPDLGPRIGGEEEDRMLTHPLAAGPPKRARKKRIEEYPEEFLKGFWEPWDKLHTPSQSRTYAAWSRLSKADRELLHAAVPLEKAERTALTWKKEPCDGVKFINERRFAKYSETLANAREAVMKTFVPVGSPQWEAWINRVGPKPTTQRGKETGWYFETEWPPDATVTSPPPLPKLDEASASSCSASEREGQGRQATEARFAYSR